MSNCYLKIKSLLFICTVLFYLQMDAQCVQPSSLTVTSKGIAHAKIGWIAQQPQPANGYEWQILNATNETIQSGNSQNAFVLITELQNQTAYTIKVRSHCDTATYSEWSTQNFTTLGLISQNEGIIGTGANATPLFGASYGPIMYANIPQRNGSVANMLFTSQEMQQLNIPSGANITGVAFDKVNAAYGGDNYPDLRLRMFAKNSTSVGPLSTTTTFGEILGTHTEVMDNPAYDLPPTIGWIDFNFNTPIAYTGGGFELATAMYQNGQTAQFSTYVIWQFTSGYQNYMIGAWPINTVPMSENLILNHNSSNFKERPNIKILYTVANQPTAITVKTQNNIAAAITQNDGSLQLVSAITPSHVSQQTVWKIISGAEFAAVNANGLVSAIANGTVIVQGISADNATLTGQVEITITNQLIPITNVNITVANNAAAAITADDATLQLSAAILPANANQNVLWGVTSGSEFANVDANGLVTAKNNGTVTIKATSIEDATKFDTIDITVSGQIVPVTSIEISVADDAEPVITTDNGTLQLEAFVLPANSDQNIVWSVISGTAFATISQDGIVTAVNNGMIIVQAKSADGSDITATLVINISNQIVKPTSLTITVEGDAQPIITTNAGTLQLNVIALPVNGNTDVTWSIVSGAAFAGVDENGLVTAIANGTAVIKAESTDNIQITDTIEITVTGQVLGTDKFTKKDIVLYPNPAKTIITIDTDATVTSVIIYNILGQKVAEANTNSINVEKLSQGTYSITVVLVNGSTFTKKIIKQ